MSRRPSPSEDLQFVLAECERNHTAMNADPKAWIRSEDGRDALFTQLPKLPNLPQIFCGKAAFQALHRLAATALRNSASASSADEEDVFRALQRLFLERFVAQDAEITDRATASLLDAAVQEAAGKRGDQTHFIACRLMDARNPERFSIGDIIFQTREAFMRDVAPHFEAYLSSVETEDAIKLRQMFKSDAETYYGAFNWAAEAKVFNSAPKVSRQRANLAVQTAINLLHILFGAYPTRRMAMGGPSFVLDRRAHALLDQHGKLNISGGWSSTSPVGFEDGWADILAREDFAHLLAGAARVIAPILRPDQPNALAAKFADAATWFGEAVREESPASRIVKAVTAVEHLVMTGRPKNISLTVAHRAAAIRFDREQPDRLGLFIGQISRYYDLRSRLAHGDLSPFDADVARFADECVEFAGETLCSGLALFEAYDLFRRAITNLELGAGYDRLVKLVHTADRLRRAPKR